MTPEEILRELEKERALVEALKADKLHSTRFTTRQRQYINSRVRELILSGANQVGKSESARAIAAAHLSGDYPAWYKGVKFDRPVTIAIAGPTVDSTLDNLVYPIFGHHDGSNFSGGWVQGALIEPSSTKQPRVYRVKHKSGGWSECLVFSYDQGARRLQGRTLDLVILDEAPSLEVLEELSQRLNATRGYLRCVLSPKEEGAVEVIDWFEDDESGLRSVVYYGINDAEWMSADQRQEIIDKNRFNPLAEATLHGRPVARTGLIFKQPQDQYEVEPRTLDGRSIIGLDLPHTTGYFAAVRLTESEGVWYVAREWKGRGLTANEYADAVAEMGGRTVPVAYPHDGGRVVGDGATAAEFYRSLGLAMLPEPAFMRDTQGKKHRSVVAVIEQLIQSLADGKLKISSDCPALLKEMARYRWVNGEPGKKPKRADDHLIDALAKAWMMREYAEGSRPIEPIDPRTDPLAHWASRRYNPLAGNPWRTPWTRYIR